jgi:uncharacterized protein
MRYHVSSLLKASVGAQIILTVDEDRHRIGNDLTVEYVRGTLRLIRTDLRVLAQGQLKTQVQAECVRCLESFDLPLTIQFEELLTLFPASPPDKTCHIGEDGYLYLDRPLAELVHLEMPMHALCRPDCKGLCSQCGLNLNEGTCHCSDQDDDPRLAALGSLLK